MSSKTSALANKLFSRYILTVKRGGRGAFLIETTLKETGYTNVVMVPKYI